MLKKSKTYLLKELVDFDFLCLTKKDQYCLLHLLDVSVGLNQFCRLIRYSKSTKSKNIFLYFNDEYTVRLANSIFNKFLEKKILVGSTPLKLIQKAGLVDVLVVFGGLLLNRNSMPKSLFSNNLFLISSMIPQRQEFSSGVYSIQNDMGDLKKIIFILVLVIKILKIR